MSVMSLVGEIKVTGDSEAKDKLKSVDAAAKETSGGFKSMLDGALSVAGGIAAFLGVGNAIGFVKDQLTDTVKVAMAHQQIQTQTAQALKSTRDASGMTAESIQELADKFSTLTSYSADTTQGAENLLLTFTNIGKNIFPDTTQAILDVSTAMHQDLQTSAIQVGKALDDPTKGMAALQRIGVTFSATQQQLVKDYLKHGDVAKAQAVILKELQKEFGGSAEAAGKTFGGQLAILQNRFEDLKVKIGTAILPVLTDLMNWFVTQGMPALQNFGNWFVNNGIPALQSLWTQINTNVLPTLQQLGQWLLQNGLPLFQQLGTILTQDIFPALGSVATATETLLRWLGSGGPQTHIFAVALTAVGTAILGIKIKEFIGDVQKMGKEAMDFAQNIVPKLVEALTGAKGISGAAQSASGEVKTLGSNSDTTKTSVKLLGDETVTAAGKEDLGALETEAKNAGDEVKVLGDNAKTTAGEQDLGALGPAAVGAGKGVATLTGDLLGAIPALLIAGVLGQQLRDFLAGIKGPGGLTVDQSANAQGQATGLQNGLFGQNPQTGAADQFFKWLSNLFSGGNSNNPGIHGRASGGTVGYGETTLVGEHGPELAVFPPGTSILPHSVLQAGASSSGAQQGPIYLQMDGVTFAQLFMPYWTQAVRSNLGVQF